MRSGYLVPGPGFPFLINWGHSLIGGKNYGAEYACSGICMIPPDRKAY